MTNKLNLLVDERIGHRRELFANVQKVCNLVIGAEKQKDGEHYAM
jgi:hypothetical protein